jgi:hypothetical protein
MRHVILRLFSLLLTFSIGVAVHVALQKSKERKMTLTYEQWRERGTIKWYAQQAKAKGEKEALIYPPTSCPAEFRNPKNAVAEAASNGSVVVAQPLEKKSSIWGDRQIVTWYKFRIIENLNNKSFPEGVLYKDVPEELLPLQSDEFLMVRTGGSVEVDSIKVIGVSDGIPDFSSSNQYLLFLMPASYNYPAPTGKTGILPYGSRSIFTVNAEGVIEPAFRDAHPLKKEIESRYRNSLELLQKSLNRQ